MTVASTLARKTFTGDAVTTSFGTNPMVFFATSDLQVRITVNATGVSTLLTENTDYTVSGGGTQIPAVGTVSLAGGSSPHGAVAAGSTLVITRVVALTQQTDFVQNDPSDADVAEATIDKLTMIAQQHDDTLGRSFTLPTGDVSGASTTIPTPAAGKLIGWDGTGTGLQNYVPADVSLVALPAVTVKGDIFAASAAGIISKLAAGTDGYNLQALSGAAAGLSYLPPQGGYSLLNGYLDWTVSGNILTVAVKTWAGADPSATDPVYYLVRDVTATVGLPVYRKLVAALSVTLNNTALAGTVNAIAFRLWAVIFNDGGTNRLALINCLSTAAGAGAGRDVTAIYPLAGFGIASATLSDNAADNSQVFYANAAITSKAYTTAGYATWETGLAAAGVWATGPTRKQLFGLGVPLPGQVIQKQRQDTGAAASGATVVPQDDTIPQITEGDQYLTVSITPASAANTLRAQAVGHFAPGGAGNSALAMSLFQDATLNALKTTMLIVPQNFFTSMPLLNEILANIAAATTFKIRCGAGSAGTTSFNGQGATRQYGGAGNSYLLVEELMG